MTSGKSRSAATAAVAVFAVLMIAWGLFICPGAEALSPGEFSANRAGGASAVTLGAERTGIYDAVPPYDEVLVGDIITFGKFEQDNNTDNGPEPVRWRVLDKQDGKLLIITEKALEKMPFFAIYWKHSSIGGYLNSSFLYDFTAEEKNMLVKTLITSDRHPDKPDTDQGSETENKLFLLSVDEAKKYFGSDEDRVCYASAFLQGILETQTDGRCDWWLRTAYDNWANGAIIANVDPKGMINMSTHNCRLGLRPACWIRLEGD